MTIRNRPLFAVILVCCSLVGMFLVGNSDIRNIPVLFVLGIVWGVCSILLAMFLSNNIGGTRK